MRIWETRYTTDGRIKFLNSFQISEYMKGTLNAILYKSLADISIHDWGFLRRIGICNGVGNWLVPKWLRWLFEKMFPFLRHDIHDLNYTLGGGWRDRLRADWGLLKYSFISIIKLFQNKEILKGCISLIIGLPLITLFFLIVIVLGWSSFNYLT